MNYGDPRIPPQGNRIEKTSNTIKRGAGFTPSPASRRKEQQPDLKIRCAWACLSRNAAGRAAARGRVRFRRLWSEMGKGSICRLVKPW